MMSTMGPVTVAVFDDFIDGDEITMAKITTLGVGEHSIFKLYQWNDKDRRFQEFDTLTECSYTEKGDHISVRGTSAKLSETEGLTPEGRQVRWEIDLKGCTSCS